MHPAFSVIFLTTLIGAGQGLFLALYTAQVYAAFRLLPAQDPVGFYALGSLIALLLLIGGLAGSFLHLGRPERAWRSAAMWRTSWLSREVIALPACMGAVAAWGLVHYTAWNPTLFTIGGAFDVDLSFLVGALGTVLCFALFICTGMIYACIKFLQEWATPLTVINYILFGGASGFMLATAFAAWQGSGLVDFYGGWAIVMTLTAFVTRTQIDRAIGHRHPPRPHRAESPGRDGRLVQHQGILPRRVAAQVPLRQVGIPAAGVPGAAAAPFGRPGQSVLQRAAGGVPGAIRRFAG